MCNDYVTYRQETIIANIFSAVCYNIKGFFYIKLLFTSKYKLLPYIAIRKGYCCSTFYKINRSYF